FKVKFIKNEGCLNIKLELGKDIYIYHDKLQINILKPQKIVITKELNIPKPVNYQEFNVQFDDLNLTIPYNLLESRGDS
ncbi:protein-disulfide reductase DsbD domain-containing protein, partial [Aliarcobacter butzleri]